MREVADTRRDSHHVAGLRGVDVGVVAHVDPHVPLLPQDVARQKFALVQGEQVPRGSRGVVLRLRGARDLYARLGVAPLGEAGAVERPGDPGELSAMCGTHPEGNWWRFDHRTDASDDLCRMAGVDLIRQNMQLKDIKAVLLQAKLQIPSPNRKM